MTKTETEKRKQEILADIDSIPEKLGRTLMAYGEQEIVDKARYIVENIPVAPTAGFHNIIRDLFSTLRSYTLQYKFTLGLCQTVYVAVYPEGVNVHCDMREVTDKYEAIDGLTRLAQGEPRGGIY